LEKFAAMSGIRSLAAPAMQRAASLMQLPPLLAALGVDFETVLDGTGIAAADLRPEAFVPFAACQTVLDRAAKLSGCDDLGLRLGRRQTLAVLGPVGDVMRHAATLGEALSDFVTFQLGNSTGAAVYLLRSANDVVLGYGVYDSGGHVSPQLYDLVLAVGHTVIAELTDGCVAAAELWSIRAAPKDLTPYRGLAQRPILFGQSQTCLVLSAASMNHALPSANRARREELLAGLAARLSPTPWGMAARTKHAMRSLMLQGRTTMPEMARHLGMYPRSLRRALAREDTTFEAIKQEVRYAVARELLAVASLPAVDIAVTLDFATPSAFVHAFRRWSGATPGMWRRQLE
jgi:AraC-like DNA-binding protein